MSSPEDREFNKTEHAKRLRAYWANNWPNDGTKPPVVCEACGESHSGIEDVGPKCWNCGKPFQSATPTLVWWSSVGAEQGLPWRVQHHDGTHELFAAVRITGTVDFIQPKEPIAGLPDGPRGVAVLIDGTLVAGK